jgi:hypothetical protein
MDPRALKIPVDLNGGHEDQFLASLYLSMSLNAIDTAVTALVVKLKSKAWKRKDIAAILVTSHELLQDDNLREATKSALIEMMSEFTPEPSGGAS